MENNQTEIENIFQSSNMNIYFEINIPNESYNHNSLNSVNNELHNISGCGDICRIPLFQREYSRHNQTVEEIEKKLERASERRNSILQEVKEKNENIVLKAMALSKQKYEKINQATENLKNKLESSLAMKELRRKQIIGEKIESAKKRMGRNRKSRSTKENQNFERETNKAVQNEVMTDNRKENTVSKNQNTN